MNHRGTTIAVGVVLLIAATLLLWHEPPPVSGPVEPVVPSEETIAADRHAPEREALPGDAMMEAYGSSDADARQDLDQVFHVLDAFQLLLKIDGGLPLGSNEEIVQALTGQNPHRMTFLSADHPAIDAQGRLVDRWETPIFFHAFSRDRIEIRSAGPDREMWTADDVHRNANGSFRGEDEITPESLFENEEQATRRVVR